MFSSNWAIAPSFNSLFVTGILLLFISLLCILHFTQIMKLDYYRKIVLLSLVTVAVGIHGLIHLGLEVNYHFNPYHWISIQ